MRTPRFWQTNNPFSVMLAPLALLYQIGAWIDRASTTPQRASVPVIAIGNVTAGGAGKTPTTLALIGLLRALGHTPHILTRGYKAAGTLTAHRVTASDDWRSVGDEALLLAAVAPTWVGRDRLASARAAAAAGATILVCDDALQHHALANDIALLVIDGPYGIGNGRLIPAGPLREPLATALARTDAVLIIGDDAQHMAAQLATPIFHASLQPSGDTSFLAQGRWLAFAGIGRPAKFYTSLRALGANLVATRDFADHHAYGTTDNAALLAQAKTLDAQLITTAKDAVKLPTTLAAQARVLAITLALADPAAFATWIATRLAPSPNP